MINTAKETVGVGVGLMAGHGIVGAMSGMPGMPAQAAQTGATIHSGLNLVGVGQLAKVGMGLANSMQPAKKKKTGNKIIDKII